MKKWPGLLTVIFALLLNACGSSGGGGSSSSASNESNETGTLRISVTDAPFPFEFVESASVIIREVWARHAGGNGFEEQLLSQPAEIDLVPLTGGVSEALVEAEIPVGSYDQVRLIVEAGEVVLSNNAQVSNGNIFNTARGNLLFPSASQSGIKVNIDPPVDVITRLSADLTLDFDLTKSFVFNGPPTHDPGVRRVLFKPVIRAVNNSENGRITLRVLGDSGTPADASDDVILSGATVTALDQNGIEEAVTSTNASGFAWIQLMPGTYDIRVEADGHETATREDNIVYLANETALGDVTLALTLGQISGAVMGDSGTPGDTSDDVVLEDVTVTIFEAGSVLPLVIGPPGENPLQTDVQGAYQFDDLIPADYDLTFEKEGFETQSLTSVTAAPSGFAPTVTLVETHGRITVTVLSDNGTIATDDDFPVGGAAVTVFDGSNAVQGSGVTDEAGFAGMLLLPGTYVVEVTAAGHNPLDVHDVEVFVATVTALGEVTLESIPAP